MAFFAVGWQRRVDAVFAHDVVVADGCFVEAIDRELVSLLEPCIDVGLAVGVVVVGFEFVAPFVGYCLGSRHLVDALDMRGDGLDLAFVPSQSSPTTQALVGFGRVAGFVGTGQIHRGFFGPGCFAVLVTSPWLASLQAKRCVVVLVRGAGLRGPRVLLES